MKAVICLLFLAQFASAQSTPFSTWLNQEVELSKAKIVEAMSYPDLEPGAIIASPSKSKPDYYYHWTRDAGLVVDVLVDLYTKSTDAAEKNKFEKHIKNFISFSIKNQASDALTGLGEPKFYVDGKPYHLPWGRPQNDGPALRALALIKWAHVQIKAGQTDYVKNELYNPQKPSGSVIKDDLEYVAARWNDASFDLWEEVLGDHFFTLYVQRASLVSGAQLAQQLGDLGASDWYLKQAQQIETKLSLFIKASHPYIPTALNIQSDDKGKKSNLDTAVLLAILRSPSDTLLSWGHVQLTKTLQTLISEFSKIYNINKTSLPGKAIGRYPEDIYDGDLSVMGNPWVLTTLAVAESYYEMARLEKNAVRAHFLFLQGDNFFKRVQTHANPDGSLSEQIQRNSGYMVSAHNLTWNYAAVLTAYWARERAALTLKIK